MRTNNRTKRADRYHCSSRVLLNQESSRIRFESESNTIRENIKIESLHVNINREKERRREGERNL